MVEMKSKKPDGKKLGGPPAPLPPGMVSDASNDAYPPGCAPWWQ